MEIGVSMLYGGRMDIFLKTYYLFVGIPMEMHNIGLDKSVVPTMKFFFCRYNILVKAYLHLSLEF